MAIPSGSERGKKLIDLLASACFHCDIDHSISQVYAVVGTVVERVDDIGTVFCDELREVGKCAGLVEQVEDGVSGLLANEVSGPALAEALIRALSDPSLRERLGKSARVRVQREFTEELFIERHRNLYEEVLGAWRPCA